MAEAIVGSVGVEILPVATNFGRDLQAKLLPEANRIGTEVGRQLADRIQSSLGSVRIQVDTGTARADLDELSGRLDELGKRSPSVRVDVDTGRARADLDELQARLDRLGATTTRHRVEIDQDRTGSGSGGGDAGLSGGFGAMAAGLSLLPMAIPVAASLIPILEGIGMAAVGAGAGVGVLALAFHGIGAAVSALGKQSSMTGQQMAAQAASQLSAADSVLNAQDAVKAAVQGVADAQRSAALSVRNAQQGVVSAEQAYTSAVYNEQQAQLAVIAARKAAAQQLQDLNNQVKDGALAQRQATLDLKNAQQNLTVVDFNPHSTQQQRDEAQLQVDQAKQHLAELGLANQRLAVTKATADKQGVANAPTVLAAEHSLTDAAQSRMNAQQGLVKAQAAVAEAQRAGAEQIAKADLSVVQSQRALAQAYAAAAAAGSASANAVSAAMANLSPAGQAFAHFVNDKLKPAFKTLTSSAQAGFLPGLQSAITALLPYLPQFGRFVGDIASAMGKMVQQAANALTGPFWKQFFSFLGDVAKNSLPILGQVLGNLATAFAGLFEALAPAGKGVGPGLVQITKAFADWATHLGTNKGFQTFLQYIADNAPVIGQFFVNLADIVGKLIVAFAPLGAVLAKILTILANFLAKLSPAQLLVLFTDVAAAVALLSGSFGAIVLAVTAVAAEFVLLYTHNKPFHDFIDGLVSKVRDFVGYIKNNWPQISATIKRTWDEQIEPTFAKFGAIIKDIWNSYLMPFFGWVKDHWKQISDVLKVGGAVIIGMFQGMGSIISWLYWNAFKPMLTLIGQLWQTSAALISGTYNNVLKPVWDKLTSAFSNVGKAFGKFRDGLSNVWGDIRKIFTDGYNFVTQNVLNKFIDAVNKVTSVLGVPPIKDIDKIGAPAAGGGGGAVGGGGGNSERHAFAHGGVVPGYAPGRDIVRADLSPGEGIIVPEAVRALGPNFIHSINKRFSNRVSTPGHFGGGGIAGLVGGLLDSGAEHVLGAAESPIKRVIDGLTPEIVKKLAQGGFGRIDGGIRSWIKGHVGGNAGAGIDIPNLAHSTLIKAALKLAGVADTAGNEGDVDMIVKFESGWNPNAINLTDSNAVAGHPSQGLMQTIPSTFEGNRLPSLPDQITDPLANLVAGIRYAVGRYGTLDQVPGVQAVHGGGKYVGYDNGGYLPPGISQVYNNTGRPEPVFTDAQWAKLQAGNRGTGKERLNQVAENVHFHNVDYEAASQDLLRRLNMRA